MTLSPKLRGTTYKPYPDPTFLFTSAKTPELGLLGKLFSDINAARTYNHLILSQARTPP